MPSRRRHLACYDIRDPKRLRRIHKLMKAYGYALQYSVFICDLDQMEKVRMKAAASAIMHLRIDSLIVIDLGAVNLDRFDFLGTRELQPPDPGPAIV